MRKRLKKKQRSCPLCKPNKMHGAPRWTSKEMQILKDHEKQCLDATMRTVV